jgi:hypothetical protein
MNRADETAEIVQAVASLRARFAIPLDPSRYGPVPLARFLDECNLLHVVLPKLTRVEIVTYLRAEGIDVGPLDNDEKGTDWLAGFLLTSGADGYVFVSETEPKARTDGKDEPRPHATPLGRRRFTAAHELGHFVLHRARMGRWIVDTNESVIDDRDPDGTKEMERQANRFAAELLMPAEVCHARAEEFRRTFRTCPRTPFGYHLASELLVSPDAMRFRLGDLGVGDE